MSISDVQPEPVSEALSRKRPPGENAWVWQVTGLCIVLGTMLALAIRTTDTMRKGGIPSSRHGVSAATVARWEERNERLQQETEELRSQVRDFRETNRDESRAHDLLKKQLQEYRALTGFGAVRGPGVKLNLRHSPRPQLSGTEPSDYWVTDYDINSLVSELWAAGAEAVSLSGANNKDGERFIVTTTVRGNGQSMVVDGRELSAPYVIQAIGNPKELRAALEMPDGIIQNRALNFMQMIEIEESKELVLPAYSRNRGADDAPASDQ